VPQLVADEVPGLLHQRQRHVQEPPLVHAAVPLGQDRGLQRQLLTDVEVRGDQVLQKRAHDLLGVGFVAHGVQQVQRALADGDVRVVQLRHHLRLELLDGVQGVAPGQLGAAVQVAFKKEQTLNPGYHFISSGVESGRFQATVGLCTLNQVDP
jgi:hypothetical protein